MFDYLTTITTYRAALAAKNIWKTCAAAVTGGIIIAVRLFVSQSEAAG